MEPSPIILVGTQRSGTTWLGSVFARHPRLAYWSEPRHVWTMGNSYTPDDVLTASHATPRVRARIRRAFDAHVRRLGKDRLVEKTPSNCLRLPFIRAVFPEAKILLVVRDGRSVIRSTEDILDKGVPLRRVLQRAAQTPLWDWPAYAGQAAMTLSRKVSRKPLAFWGPRPPGWRDWVRDDPPDVVLARQWAGTIMPAVRAGEVMDPGSFHRFRYEDLMARPREIMSRIVEFCGLSGAEPLVEHVEKTADPARQDKWRDQLDAATLELIRPHMEPVLLELGYAW